MSEAVPQGPDQRYVVEVEGSFVIFLLRIEDADGKVEYSDFVEATVVAEEDTSSPAEVRLNTNYPNPFAGAATFSFDLLEELAQGSRSVVWQASEGMVGGFYRVRLTADEDTATVLSVYTGTDADQRSDRRRVATALGQTDARGRFATDDRARFPQRYDGIEIEYRDENNVLLGVLRPSNEIVLVLRDGAGREQRYERTLTGGSNAFELTWDPE